MLDEKIVYYIDEVEKGMRDNYIPPVTFEVNVSNRCMLKCRFCIFAQYMDQKIIPCNTYTSMIQAMSGSGVRSITFTGGGEPLTHPKFALMAELALKLGLEIGLVTNGVLLDTVPHPESYSFIRVSLDCATPETYRLVKGQDQFDRVIANIERASYRTTLGISYVVCPENKHEMALASALGKSLGAAYVQFKPAWNNGSGYTDYEPPPGSNVIDTRRYLARDKTPCIISSLVGVVGADCGVYYCCQHKGEDGFRLGTLKSGSEIMDIWKQRRYFHPDRSRCPHCRYMNYAHAYEKVKNNFLIKHRNFL